MLVNGSAIRSVFTGLSTQFHNALVAVPTDYQATTMTVPSNGSGVDYAWLSRFPKMRQWVGDKHIKALAIGNYYVKNLDWETTIAVDRNDLEDDQLGIYNAQAQMAGQSAGELYGDIITSLKNAAFTGLGMDGVAYYSDSHTLTSADGTVRTQDNKLTAALSAASLSALVGSYGAARQAIMGFTDEEGQPLGLMPDLLEVPPALEAVAPPAASRSTRASPAVPPGCCTSATAGRSSPSSSRRARPRPSSARPPWKTTTCSSAASSSSAPKPAPPGPTASGSSRSAPPA